MKYPERLLSSGERIDLAFRPHWKQLIWPVFVSVVALAGIVVLAVRAEGTPMWVGFAAVVAIWLALFAPPFTRWFFTHYIITNERLIVRRGMFARHGKEIPLEVMNDATFAQTFWERLLRSGDLIIESAGEQGQSHFSDIPDPEGIQSEIYRLREARMVALQGGSGPVEQLEMLARLHEDGVLSDEEFAEKRSKLLDQI
ncbi:bacterial membrane flanked domain protein [bacterium BMS3Abin02]|nr:bacterial membrane flanked domain protein [bacterium BMS3Abin02]GBE21136.1 bacterial membrane flanked domain protein [bacterium BMS3Bbin01]HDH25569.1 PH domain-containing protein [Actinomycetota bacterium]HDK44824.1 PH domain-containing protein [Actinomycetota bacterium]